MTSMGSAGLGLALLVAASLAAFGCARERAPRILFMPGVADAFYLTMEHGAREAARRLGAEFAVADYPEVWGPEYQVPILEAAAANGDWDVLLIAPTSTEALIAPLKAIHEAGTVIVTVDTFLGDGDYGEPSGYSFPLAYIGSDNFVGGRLMAERLAKLVGERGRVFCQATNPDTSSIQDRVDGFISGIAEFPNMELVATEWCQDIQALAEQQTLGALMEHRDIVGVFGVNVFSAQGSYLAVVDAGLEGAVKICSWDATEDLIAALEAGQVDIVLAQKPAEMGAIAVERALEFLADPAGARIPRRILTGFEFFTRDTVDDPALSAYVYR